MKGKTYTGLPTHSHMVTHSPSHSNLSHPHTVTPHSNRTHPHILTLQLCPPSLTISLQPCPPSHGHPSLQPYNLAHPHSPSRSNRAHPHTPTHHLAPTVLTLTYPHSSLAHPHSPSSFSWVIPGSTYSHHFFLSCEGGISIPFHTQARLIQQQATTVGLCSRQKVVSWRLQ